MEFLHEYLDAILVPIGLLNMLIYHLYLLYNYFNRPFSTCMGYENLDKESWVGNVLEQGDNVNRGLAVISSSTSAATYLASVSLTLRSLIGTWMANSRDTFFPREMIYGNTSPSINSVKNICLLTCFLLAFSFFVQSARHFVHSNYLLSTPGAIDKVHVHLKKAKRAVKRGSEFWALGLRALYFALNFLLWSFGPIPMLVSSDIMAVILYFHDFKSESDDQD